jgi:hypothetical protein
MKKTCKKIAIVAALVIVTSSAAQSAQAALFISEVAPWSSGNSSLGADWFEVTNSGASAVNINGWKMDDNSHTFANAVALNGITSIAAGESVIFTESSSSLASAFKTLWFGTTAPAGLQIGTYSGSGVGLSTSSDEVNLYNAAGALQASVTFGASPSGPFQTFDNKAGLNNTTITQLSAIGVNGAFAAKGDTNEIGSPGTVTATPIPAAAWLLGSGLGMLGAIRRKRA